MSTLAETKITLGQLYRKSWAIFKENLFAIIMVNLVVALPVNIVNYGLSIIRRTSSFKFAFDILSTLVSLVAGIAALATVFIVVNALNGNAPISFKESFFMAYKRLGTYIGTGVLQYIITFALILLFIIPGVIWLIYYTFMCQAIALTDYKWKNALDYSKFVVKGNWWKVFGNLFVLSLVPMVIHFCMFYPYRYLIKSKSELDALIILINVISNVLSSFVSVGATILYINLVSVKDASDNEQTVYEKINNYVNKDSSIESGEAEDIWGPEDPEKSKELENLDESEKSEETDVDDDSPRCSTCGIKVEPGQVVCPMCHSIIR